MILRSQPTAVRQRMRKWKNILGDHEKLFHRRLRFVLLFIFCCSVRESRHCECVVNTELIWSRDDWNASNVMLDRRACAWQLDQVEVKFKAAGETFPAITAVSSVFTELNKSLTGGFAANYSIFELSLICSLESFPVYEYMLNHPPSFMMILVFCSNFQKRKKIDLVTAQITVNPRSL